jgi:hypothetical protein
VFDPSCGFKYTLPEPQGFWKGAPAPVRLLYRCFNSPVSAGWGEKALSPTRMLRQTATPEDFVSFKLDIDAPEVEIPFAMELLRNPEMARLVDEFFFELRFRCDIVMYCGWKDKMPQEFHGLALDRESAVLPEVSGSRRALALLAVRCR